MKFKILIEMPISTRNFTIESVEDGNFQEFKKQNGRKGLQKLTDYLRNFNGDIWDDIVNDPIIGDS